jgi:hypothetical protein
VHTAGALRVTGTQTTAGTGIYLDQTSGVGNVSVYGPDVSTQGTFRVYTATSNGGTGSVKLTVDSSGRVGIGTTSPSQLLHVSGGYSLLNGLRIGGADTTNTIYQNSAIGISSGDYISFATNSAGPYERARLTSDGKFLVGTSTTLTGPYWADVAKVQVAGQFGVGQFSSFVNSGLGAGLVFQKSRSASVGGNTIVQADDLLMDISVEGNDGTGFKRAVAIQALVDGTPGTNDMPGRLVFSTTADGASSPTERLRITSDGQVSINNTSPSSSAERLVINSRTLFGVEYCVITNVSSTDDQFHYRFLNGNGVVGSIKTNGTATSFNTSSDYRLKENVAPLTGAVDRVNQLQVRRFNFIADPDKTVDGFIAHEAQAVVPECVTGEKDAVDDDGNPVYQGIDQSKLVPLLTAALQEALQKIKDLEGRLTAAGL